MTGPVDLAGLAAGKRWFGDKSRTIVNAEVIWSVALPGSPAADLTVVEFRFTTGDPAHYLIAIDRATGADVTTSRVVTDWLARVPETTSRDQSGLVWQAFPGQSLPSLDALPAANLGVEQSNTSIRYGDLALVKVNRKLRSGLSPEVELAAVTAKALDQSYAAASYGALLLRGVLPDEVCLALYSAFVPNQGDAWSEVLDHLRGGDEGYRRATHSAAAIGDTTARMHLGLLSDPWRPDVSPERISAERIGGWADQIESELFDLERHLAGEPHLSERAKALEPLLKGAHDALLEQIAGFSGLLGTYAMRVHGDYHLGQLLRTGNGGYVVVDFDGEPNKTLAERRQKYSALRDVAGMLRSFSYARGTIEREAGSGAALGAWEAEARAAFLEAYIPVARTASVPIIPAAGDDIRRALNALEIEKAIFECGYELNNRPDWLWLPLTRLVQSR